MKIVIVAAGGNGKRMAVKENKIFLTLLGWPIIYHTLATLEKAGCVDKVFISARSEDIARIKKIIQEGNFNKVEAVVEANGSRQKSTWKVLQNFQTDGIKKNDLVGVHNAVNPLVREEEIEKVFSEAQKYGAALLMVPARDTVKIVDRDNFVKVTPLRKDVWNAQTPQVGRFDWLFKAHQTAARQNFEGTDDAMLMERMGKKVKVVLCSAENFKITFPFDLSLAEEILKRRGKDAIAPSANDRYFLLK